MPAAADPPEAWVAWGDIDVAGEASEATGLPGALTSVLVPQPGGADAGSVPSGGYTGGVPPANAPMIADVEVFVVTAAPAPEPRGIRRPRARG